MIQKLTDTTPGNEMVVIPDECGDTLWDEVLAAAEQN